MPAGLRKHAAFPRCESARDGQLSPRVIFPNKLLPYLLVAPQLAITMVFFVWPAFQSLRGALFQQDAFGLGENFVGLDNFAKLFGDPA